MVWVERKKVYGYGAALIECYYPRGKINERGGVNDRDVEQCNAMQGGIQRGGKKTFVNIETGGP